MSASSNVAGRWQQVIPAGIVLALAVWISFVSFNVKDPEPYLFPRLIALAMLGLAAVAFRRALRGGNRTGSGFDARTMLNIAPGVVLMILYVFVIAERLGFYASSFFVFLTLFSLYDPAPHTPRIWAKRLIITAGFMVVLYLIFALVLRVQTPRGIFI